MLLRMPSPMTALANKIHITLIREGYQHIQIHTREGIIKGLGLDEGAMRPYEITAVTGDDQTVGYTVDGEYISVHFPKEPSDVVSFTFEFDWK